MRAWFVISMLGRGLLGSVYGRGIGRDPLRSFLSETFFESIFSVHEFCIKVRRGSVTICEF